MTNAHESLINHLNNRRNCCYAPSDRYCPEGRELWLADKAASLAAFPSREARAYALSQLRDNLPGWAEEIERRVVAMFEQRKMQERRAA